MRDFINITKTVLHKVQLLHAVVNDIRNGYKKVRKPVLINKTFWNMGQSTTKYKQYSGVLDGGNDAHSTTQGHVSEQKQFLI